MNTLKTLEENNSEKRNITFDVTTPRLNGIACPVCGNELLDSSPHITLTSEPAQYHIHCSSCDYRGYRL